VPLPAAAGLAVVLSLVAWAFLRHAGTSYDLEWHLSWGHWLVHGDLPDFRDPGAPTEHPLTLAAAALADIVPGISQHALLHASAYLAYGALAVVVLLLGAELFSWGAGLLAAAVIAFSASMAANTAIAFQDVSATTLTMLAVLLAVRNPRRPVPPLVVLGLGGLLRPEVWGLAGAYWLVQLPGRTNAERARLAALAAMAPVVWMAIDALVTSEPLFSFTATRSGAEAAQRTTGIAHAPGELLRNLRGVIDEVVPVAGGAGAVAAAALLGPLRSWVRPDRALAQTVLVPLGTLVLSCAAFVVLGAGHLSLLERYVFTPAALLALFFGFAVTSAWHLRSRPLAALAAILGAVALVGAGTLVPRQVERTQNTIEFFDDQYRGTHGLETLADIPAARTAIDRCPRVAVTSYRARPYLANALRRTPLSIGLADTPEGLRARGALVVPADERVRDVLLLIGAKGGPLPPFPPGYRRAAGNDAWDLLTRGC
jgi:hypothetical protein